MGLASIVNFLSHHTLKGIVGIGHYAGVNLVQSAAGLGMLVVACYFLRNNGFFRIYMLGWAYFFGLPMIGINLNELVLKSVKGGQVLEQTNSGIGADEQLSIPTKKINVIVESNQAMACGDSDKSAKTTKKQPKILQKDKVASKNNITKTKKSRLKIDKKVKLNNNSVAKKKLLIITRTKPKSSLTAWLVAFILLPLNLIKWAFVWFFSSPKKQLADKLVLLEKKRDSLEKKGKGEQALLYTIKVANAEKKVDKAPDSKAWQLANFLYRNWVKILSTVIGWLLYNWWFKGHFGIGGRWGRGDNYQFSQTSESRYASLAFVDVEQDVDVMVEVASETEVTEELGGLNQESGKNRGFATPLIRGVAPLEAGVSSTLILQLHASNLGVPEEWIARFVVAVQTIQQNILTGNMHPSALDAFLEAKGNLLLPGEDPKLFDGEVHSLARRVRALDRQGRIRQRQLDRLEASRQRREQRRQQAAQRLADREQQVAEESQQRRDREEARQERHQENLQAVEEAAQERIDDINRRRDEANQRLEDREQQVAEESQQRRDREEARQERHQENLQAVEEAAQERIDDINRRRDEANQRLEDREHRREEERRQERERQQENHLNHLANQLRELESQAAHHQQQLESLADPVQQPDPVQDDPIQPAPVQDDPIQQQQRQRRARVSQPVPSRRRVRVRRPHPVIINQHIPNAPTIPLAGGVRNQSNRPQPRRVVREPMCVDDTSQDEPSEDEPNTSVLDRTNVERGDGTGGARHGGRANQPLLAGQGGRKTDQPSPWARLSGVVGSVLSKKDNYKALKELAEKLAKNSTAYQKALEKISWNNFDVLHLEDISTGKILYHPEFGYPMYPSQSQTIDLSGKVMTHSSTLKQAQDGLSKSQLFAKQTLAKKAQEELLKQTIKNGVSTVCKGTLTGIGTTYAFSAGGTGWSCLRGNNEAYNQANERCQQRLRGKTGMDYCGTMLFENSSDKVSTFCKEVYKEAPPIKTVAKQAVGASVGGYVGGLVGSIVPGAGTFVGGVLGSFIGSWLAG